MYLTIWLSNDDKRIYFIEWLVPKDLLTHADGGSQADNFFIDEHSRQSFGAHLVLFSCRGLAYHERNAILWPLVTHSYMTNRRTRMDLPISTNAAGINISIY